MPRRRTDAVTMMLLALLFSSMTTLGLNAQGDQPAPEDTQEKPHHDWVFNGRGQKTDQVHYTDVARDDEFFPIKLNNHWGLMNQDGEVVVFPRFDWTDYSYENYARYISKGKTGYLRGDPADDNDPKEFFIIASYDYADRFNNGTAVVMNEERWGMIDLSGRELLPMTFDGVLRMKGGFAGVEKDGLCGFVNRAGRIKIPLQFKRVRSFHEGFAAVQFVNGKWGYIDKRGKVVWSDNSGQVTLLGDFHDHYARVQGRTANGETKWGYIDKRFRFSVNPLFDAARDFHEGLAAVKLNGKWGYIQVNGRWAIQPRYEEADDFGELDASEAGEEEPRDRRGRDLRTAGTYAMVMEGGRWGYVDRTGRPTMVAQFKEAQPFFRGLARVSRGDSFAYVAERGRVRFDPLVALRLGLVNVSSRESSRVIAAQQVNTGVAIQGPITRTTPGDDGIANNVLYPPAKRPQAKVPYEPEHLYEEMLPVED